MSVVRSSTNVFYKLHKNASSYVDNLSPVNIYEYTNCDTIEKKRMKHTKKTPHLPEFHRLFYIFNFYSEEVGIQSRHLSYFKTVLSNCLANL